MKVECEVASIMAAPTDDSSILALFSGSDSTSSNYRARLRVLRQKLGMPLAHVLSHPDEVYPLLKQAYPNITSRRAVMTALLAVSRRSGAPPHEGWVKLQRNLQAVASMDTGRNEPTVQQLRAYVSYEDIALVLLQLRRNPRAHDSITDSMRLVLLSMIDRQRPKRNDHGRCRIYLDRDPGPDAGAENHLVWWRSARPERAYFVYVRYKTQKQYGRVEEDADATFLEDLSASLRRHPRDYVFVNRQGRPFASNNAYGKFVQNAFEALFNGRAMSTSVLRHAYISTKLDLGNMTVAEREREAKLMLHSPAMQAKYEWSAAAKADLCASLCGVPKADRGSAARGKQKK